jgi:hypothetical protein
VGAVMPSIGKVQDIVSTERWKSLIEKLLEFVSNYQTRIVKSTGSFQF